MSKKERKPGTVPPNKLGVYDRAGQKRTHAPAIHPAMGAHQRAGAGVGGLSHATAAVTGGMGDPSKTINLPIKFDRQTITRAEFAVEVGQRTRLPLIGCAAYA